MVESGLNCLGLRIEYVDWMMYSLIQVYVYKKRDFIMMIIEIDEFIVEDKCKVILILFYKILKNFWYQNCVLFLKLDYQICFRGQIEIGFLE